jgi:signal transduction histidine kinase
METISLYPDSEIGLLNKEKEIQLTELNQQQLQLIKNENQQNQLMLFIVFSLIVLVVITLSYRIQVKKNKALKIQQIKIEQQSEEIKTQSEKIGAINESLETKVVERTSELEKKNLALEEYTFIIAHNLRGPLARVLGLVNLLMSPIIKPDEQPIILEHLKKSSDELDTTIKSIIVTLQKDE